MTEVNQQQVFDQVKEALVELFEIDEADIQPDAHL
ncbi:acyl carrier protein, partial [Vibrio anguillarum]|nr:acyl carrier protein [Vibrio anguillarum]